MVRHPIFFHNPTPGSQLLDICKNEGGSPQESLCMAFQTAKTIILHQGVLVNERLYLVSTLETDRKKKHIWFIVHVLAYSMCGVTSKPTKKYNQTQLWFFSAMVNKWRSVVHPSTAYKNDFYP